MLFTVSAYEPEESNTRTNKRLQSGVNLRNLHGNLCRRIVPYELSDQAIAELLLLSVHRQPKRPEDLLQIHQPQLVDLVLKNANQNFISKFTTEGTGEHEDAYDQIRHPMEGIKERPTTADQLQ
jgi:hypothetical protein